MTEPRPTASTINDTQLDELYRERNEARQHAATIAAQRDRLRIRMNTLADRWDLEGPPPGNRPLTELRAEISVAPVAPDAEPTPSRRAGLRDEIAHAIHRYDNEHMLSGNDIPSKHHRGEADAVLTLLYREWPWLRAEAEDAATDPELRRQLADAIRALGHAETELAGVRALRDRWVKAGPPPLGTSMSRWWDRRLVELHAALNPKES